MGTASLEDVEPGFYATHNILEWQSSGRSHFSVAKDRSLLTFPSILIIPQVLREIREQLADIILVPILATQTMFFSRTYYIRDSSGIHNQDGCTDCLEIERSQFLCLGYDINVTEALLASRKQSTNRIYNTLWKAFVKEAYLEKEEKGFSSWHFFS